MLREPLSEVQGMMDGNIQRVKQQQPPPHNSGSDANNGCNNGQTAAMGPSVLELVDRVHSRTGGSRYPSRSSTSLTFLRKGLTSQVKQGNPSKRPKSCSIERAAERNQQKQHVGDLRSIARPTAATTSIAITQTAIPPRSNKRIPFDRHRGSSLSSLSAGIFEAEKEAMENVKSTILRDRFESHILRCARLEEAAQVSPAVANGTFLSVSCQYEANSYSPMSKRVYDPPSGSLALIFSHYAGENRECISCVDFVHFALDFRVSPQLCGKAALATVFCRVAQLSSCCRKHSIQKEAHMGRGDDSATPMINFCQFVECFGRLALYIYRKPRHYNHCVVAPRHNTAKVSALWKYLNLKHSQAIRLRIAKLRALQGYRRRQHVADGNRQYLLTPALDDARSKGPLPLPRARLASSELALPVPVAVHDELVRLHKPSLRPQWIQYAGGFIDAGTVCLDSRTGLPPRDHQYSIFVQNTTIDVIDIAVECHDVTFLDIEQKSVTLAPGVSTVLTIRFGGSNSLLPYARSASSALLARCSGNLAGGGADEAMQQHERRKRVMQFLLREHVGYIRIKSTRTRHNLERMKQLRKPGRRSYHTSWDRDIISNHGKEKFSLDVPFYVRFVASPTTYHAERRHVGKTGGSSPRACSAPTHQRGSGGDAASARKGVAAGSGTGYEMLSCVPHPVPRFTRYLKRRGGRENMRLFQRHANTS